MKKTFSDVLSGGAVTQSGTSFSVPPPPPEVAQPANNSRIAAPAAMLFKILRRILYLSILRYPFLFEALP
jgi:hypothetical protein